MVEGEPQERSLEGRPSAGSGPTQNAQPRKPHAVQLFPNNGSERHQQAENPAGLQHIRHPVLLEIASTCLCSASSPKASSLKSHCEMKSHSDKQISHGRKLARLDPTVLDLRVHRLVACRLICHTQGALPATGLRALQADQGAPGPGS